MTTEDKKPRRRRADSAESAVQDMMAAERTITPPKDMDLSGTDLLIFTEIIDELPRGEWTPHMIRVAASMAKDMRSLQDEQIALSAEGSVLTNSNGNPVRNPRCVAVSGLSSSIIATRRSLSIHSRAKAGFDNRVLARRRELQRDNENNAPDDPQGLLAKPKLH